MVEELKLSDPFRDMQATPSAGTDRFYSVTPGLEAQRVLAGKINPLPNEDKSKVRVPGLRLVFSGRPAFVR